MNHHLPQLIHPSLRKVKLLPPFESSALEPWSYRQILPPGEVNSPPKSPFAPVMVRASCLVSLPPASPAGAHLVQLSRRD